jgi:endonuclease/exonuclease/phosphatase family metal-dependent hydrolase
VIRVVTYNVSGASDPGAVGRVLAALRPDVVCMLEAPSGRGLRRVARAAGLATVVRAGRRRTSTAILVGERVRVLSHARYGLTAADGSPPRHLAHAIVGVGGLRLSVAATQFGMRPERRLDDTAEVERLLAGVELPSVLGVDLNESPKGPVASRLAQVLQDAFAVAGTGHGDTYPTPDPSSRQDFCFVDRALTIGRAHVPADDPVDVASHHRPVVVDLAGSETEDEPGRVAQRPARAPDDAAESAA